MNNITFANEVSLQQFRHLDVRISPDDNAAWLYFNSHPRPCYTLTLLQELDEFQSILARHSGRLPYNDRLVDIHWNVITSDHTVFSFGGDLGHFFKCIQNRDKKALAEYARSAIDAVYYNHIGRELDITTISLIHGNALGGGFEAALSSHILFAERSAEMGFPEVLFNLFPGMGAYNLLTKRVSPAQAERMMLSGRLYTAEELHDMGVVDYLVEDGDGELAVHELIRGNRNRTNSFSSLNKVRQCASPIDYQELVEIGNIWVESALKLTEKDLRMMSRLVRSQEKFAGQEQNMAPAHATAL